MESSNSDSYLEAGSIDTEMQSRILNVKSRIASVCLSCSISPDSVRLVAVSKTKPPASILQALSHGQICFGENYVDELVEKAVLLPKLIKWHFIGHLQSNKAKTLLENVPNLDILETVDSLKLALKLNSILEDQPRDPLKVFIQVKTSNEQSKFGIEASDCPDLAAQICLQCPRLRLSGLMTIGEEGNRDCFLSLSNTRQQTLDHLLLLNPRSDCIPSSLELSMGMSADFEDAIRAGSTNVRVGSVIFGERSKK